MTGFGNSRSLFLHSQNPILLFMIS